jgi:putative tryptophan/tyrosine transport system substrate-binding protein
VKRREFITLLSSVVAWPLASAAQDRKTVGVLVVGAPDPNVFLGVLRQGLRETGYTEGKNIQIDVRSAEGKAERLHDLAAELVRRKVDIIIGFQTPAVQAAKEATTEIPIVMDAGDPVGMGFVSSLARPGGNITGMSAVTAELAPKAIEYLKQVVPSIRRLGLFLNASDPFRKSFLEHNQVGVGRLGLELQPMLVNGPGEVDSAFVTATTQKIDALMIQPSLAVARAAELALAHRLPAASLTGLFARAGGLLSYSANYTELWRQMAVYVAKILNGANPANLPVAQPTKFELVVNLRAAETLGLTVPPSLLAHAHEVIE